MERSSLQGAAVKGPFADSADPTGEESKHHAAGRVATRLTEALSIVMPKLRMKPKGGICMAQGQATRSCLVPSTVKAFTLTKLRKPLVLSLHLSARACQLAPGKQLCYMESLRSSQRCLQKLSRFLECYTSS